MKVYCNKYKDCTFENICEIRYKHGVYEAAKKAKLNFCLGYKRKWWKFWA